LPRATRPTHGGAGGVDPVMMPPLHECDYDFPAGRKHLEGRPGSTRDMQLVGGADPLGYVGWV
jgi:hypothetical protein